jgi:cytochrome c oxidase assembly protein subunit 15
MSGQKEFTEYKTSPEYKKINSHFDLQDFKGIFWLEFIHRILGRLTGIIILLPMIFFALTKKLNNPRNYIAMAILIILQGFMGWYMVKSGLINNPHVSHYRLAAHLFLAIALYLVILWEIFRNFNCYSCGNWSLVYKRHPRATTRGSTIKQWILGSSPE